jgi:WD40 repeat protein
MGNTCNSKSYEYEHKQHCDEKISLIHDGSSILSTSSCYNDIDQCYYIGTCSDDNRIAILKKDDSNRYTICHYLLGHEKAVNRIAMNKNVLWSASRDLSLKQWNINSNDKCLQTISKAHELNISAVVTSTDNRTIYSGSRDYSVKVWDSEKGLCKEQYKVPRNIVTSLEIGNEHMLYQGSEDLCVRVWDTR